jgi:hypothetical protein
MSTLVLDSEAFSALARARRENAKLARLHAALTAALGCDTDILVPAAALAEQYRGGAYDQIADAFLARHPFLEVIPTDRALTRRIGHILARAGRGSADHVDATVVAAAIGAGGAVIITGDPDDIGALSAGLPSVVVESV